jgi:hypothetical protein
MPDISKLAKAELLELDAKFTKTINPDKATKVQFNPESLKVSFANQIASPSGSGDNNGPQARQFVGAGTTKLSATLYFDVTSELPQGLPQVNDVRKLTERIAYFITPVGDPKANPKKFMPPAVRFRWGSFQFDGIMESMEETLELFSFEGRPLRASIAISLTQQKITAFVFNAANEPPAATRRGGPAAGTSPVTEAPAGASVQSLASNSAGGAPAAEWQVIAQANGIENPRMLKPGQLIDLNLTKINVQIG